MKKAIETPAEPGGEIAGAPHGGGAAASSEEGSGASAREVGAPGAEASAEGGREKPAVRRPRRPRRGKHVAAAGEEPGAAADPAANGGTEATAEIQEAAGSEIAAANGGLAAGGAGTPVEPLAAEVPTVSNGLSAAEPPIRTPDAEAAPEKRKRRRSGGRRKAPAPETAVQESEAATARAPAIAEAPVAAAAAGVPVAESEVAAAAIVGVAGLEAEDAAPPDESSAAALVEPRSLDAVAAVPGGAEAARLSPDREAAEPISAGRPEIEVEPPTLPEPPEPEPESEAFSIDLLPEPPTEQLEAVPPDLPQPPARERGRRRRSRAERAAARARAAGPPPEVEDPIEAPAVAPVVQPAPEAAEPRGGRRKREKPNARQKAEEKPEKPEVREKAQEKPEKAAGHPPEAGGGVGRPTPLTPVAEKDEKPDGREGDGRRERERADREKTEKIEKLFKEIIVNVDSRETRIAVIENNRLVELHVEREERVVGSIYKGRVANVLPGMDAAFVDIGLDRNAFLYVGDILYEAAGDEESRPVYRRAGREVKIRDVAKTGQEILVQVVKGPRGTKGARVSTRMSLPGRYIVLMPEAENLGVSRKIEDAGERERLRKIGEAVRPHGFGMIIRTEAEEKTEQDLRQDAKLLVDLWHKIQEKARKTPPPGLVHQDLSLLFKTIRDVFGSDVDRMLIDSASDHQKALELLGALSPELKGRVELYSGAEPIFHKFGLDDEIERLLRRKVWLKSGGYITIDSTEALTAIDVNTGKFIGSTSLSDTILKTNLDAVNEIARQLRLRDLGGMIVLDFIDMNSARDRAQVMAALDRALKKDRTRTKIAHISPLGLVEMTRKRTGETVTELLTQSCPYCQGRGRVGSPESMSIQIERLVKRRCSEMDVDAILVYANPEVAAHLVGPEGDNIEQLEKEVRRPVYVRARHDFHVEKFEIVPGDMMELEQQIMPYRGGQVVECIVQKLELITAPRSGAWVDGYFVDLANGTRFQGQKTKVRLIDVRRSFALGEPVSPAHTLDKSEPI